MHAIADRGRHAWLWRLIMLAALMLVCPAAEPADSAPPSEYAVKAAFLLNFTRFVEWPATAFDRSDSPLVIGILGDNPFGSLLDDVVRDERVRDRHLQVRCSIKAEDLKGCQLVFVCRSERGHLDQVIDDLGHGAILTVSDIDGFADHGGVIRLYLSGKKIRFEINQSTAKQHELKLSAQLLSLGKIIDPVDGAAP
jgi:hypothetical protein